MDIIYDLFDGYLISPLGLYEKAGVDWAPDDMRRQAISLYAIGE